MARMPLVRGICLIVLSTAGVAAGVLGGCDMAAKTTIYSGLVTLADSLVTATFQNIELSNGVMPQSGSTGAGT